MYTEVCVLNLDIIDRQDECFMFESVIHNHLKKVPLVLAIGTARIQVGSVCLCVEEKRVFTITDTEKLENCFTTKTRLTPYISYTATSVDERDKVRYPRGVEIKEVLLSQSVENADFGIQNIVIGDRYDSEKTQPPKKERTTACRS